MRQQPPIKPLVEVATNLLQVVKADRELMAELVGPCASPEFQATLAHTDKLIAEAEAIVFAYKTDARRRA